MAEIKIEKKSPVWPWVLIGLLLVALLLYFFVFRDDNEADKAVAASTDTAGQYATAEQQNGGNEAAVADYVSYINEADMGKDHVYTSTALQKLVSAIRAKSEKAGYDVNTELSQATTVADKIQQDPSATSHGNSIREAASVLTTAMGNLQQAKYQNLNREMDELKQAAKGISAEEHVLQQKESVKSFFQKAGDLLQKMN